MNWSRRGFVKIGVTATAARIAHNIAGGDSMYALADVSRNPTFGGPELVGVRGPVQAVFSLADGHLMGWWVEGNTKNQEAVTRKEALRKAMARYSSDGGKTWTDPELLFEFPGELGSYGQGPGLTDQNGAVHLFGLHNEGCGPGGFADAASCHCHLYQVTSTDSGKTWTSPQYCDFGHEYTGAINSVIQLRSGRILAPISYLSERKTGRFVTKLSVSDDSGKTWRPSKGECVVDSGDNLIESGACEPSCIELRDGRIWMLMRTQTGYQYEAFSSDGGDTWTDPAPSRFISSNSPCALLRLRDGRIVLVWNNCMTPERRLGIMASYDRQILAAAISADDGKTWQGYREIARIGEGAHQVSYPTLTESTDGCIIVSSVAGKGYFPEGVIRVDPNWLTETHAHDDFKHGLTDWATFDCEGATTIPSPDHPGSNVLALRKPKADVPVAASWNFPFGSRGKLQLRFQIEPTNASSGQYQYLSLADFFCMSRIPHHEGTRTVGWDIISPEGCFTLRFAPDGQLAIASSAGVFHSLFTPTRTRFTSGQWYTLDFAWDCANSTCSLDINHRHVADIPMLRASKGVSYLRLWASAESVEDTGLLIESVKCAVS